VKRAISESKAIAELPDDVIIKEILRNNLTDYGFFITKALVNYSDPLNEFNFYLSVKHDEKGRYLASLRTLLGIEVYRLFIDRDKY